MTANIYLTVSAQGTYCICFSFHKAVGGQYNSVNKAELMAGRKTLISFNVAGQKTKWQAKFLALAGELRS